MVTWNVPRSVCSPRPLADANRERLGSQYGIDGTDDRQADKNGILAGGLRGEQLGKRQAGMNRLARVQFA